MFPRKNIVGALKGISKGRVGADPWRVSTFWPVKKDSQPAG